MEYFKPPYPKPREGKTSLFGRVLSGWDSYLDLLSEYNYRMKIGHIKLPKMSFFILNERSLVKQVLKTAWEDFPKHRTMLDLLRPILGDNVFSRNGKDWENLRKMMEGTLVYAKPENVFPLMSSAVTEMNNRFHTYQEGIPVDIDLEMTHVTADIIFRTTLSHTFTHKNAKDVYAAFKEFQNCMQKQIMLSAYKLPTFYHRRKSEVLAENIRSLLTKIIKPRYESYINGTAQKYSDILAALMEARDPNTGKSFSYDELIEHISGVFLGGHETTTASLIWSLYLIASCPHTQKALQTEVDAIRNDILSFEDIKSLKTTRNVFREALRLYPPIGFLLREAAKEHCMLNEKIKTGDTVLISPWLIHRHREQWQDPDLFKPERFEDPASKESIQCSYLPFGEGPRMCPGQGFAQQEALLIIATLIKNFQFSTVPGFAVKPVGRITIRPKNGLKLIIHQRINKKEN